MVLYCSHSSILEVLTMSLSWTSETWSLEMCYSDHVLFINAICQSLEVYSSYMLIQPGFFWLCVTVFWFLDSGGMNIKELRLGLFWFLCSFLVMEVNMYSIGIYVEGFSMLFDKSCVSRPWMKATDTAGWLLSRRRSTNQEWSLCDKVITWPLHFDQCE